MGPPLVTTIDATVPVEREEERLDAYRQLNEEARPEGLLRSELLRGQDGAWRIQTTWRDKEALAHPCLTPPMGGKAWPRSSSAAAG
jgi:hypothetical protein